MRRRRVHTHLVGGLAAGVLLVVPGAASAVQKDIIGKEQSASPSAVSEFWTPERMREAIPLESPADAAALVAGKSTPDFRAAPTDQETFQGNDTLYPQRVHGKLFLVINGTPASCSATVVTSSSQRTRNVVLTAGHCLANPGPALGQTTFSTQVAFVPGYRNGVRPFGTFPASNLRTPGIWALEGLISFDVGAANVISPTANSASAVTIQDQLGSRGISFNRPNFRGQTFQIFGYPGQPAEFYDGERLILCVSQFLGFEFGTGSIKAGPCRQQEGSSGGAWLLGNGLLNSVVSHGGCAIPSTACTTTVGTYLDDLAFQLWAAAGGGITGKLRKRIKKCRKKHKKFNREQRCVNRVETFQPVVPPS
jgi:hypothetical protein